MMLLTTSPRKLSAMSRTLAPVLTQKLTRRLLQRWAGRLTLAGELESGRPPGASAGSQAGLQTERATTERAGAARSVARPGGSPGQVADDAAPTPSDAALLQAVAGRDETALAQLYDRYSGAAYGLALRVLRDPASAQDTVHDVFLKLWQRPQLHDPQRGAPSTLLLTMVRHSAISRLRGLEARGLYRQLPLESEDGQPLPLPDPQASLPERAEARQRSERLGALLLQLKPVQRETVERAYFLGESRERIADAMSVPVGTVKSRLKYALDRLRGLIGEEPL
jgi:RNA polymerase sigma-70 factor, ECF subfamily